MRLDKHVFLRLLASLGLLCLALLVIWLAASGGADFFNFDFQPQELELQDDDRILVLAPHPDDEVLGAGGVIMKAAAQGLPLHIAFLTFGDFNEWSFALYRRRPDLTPAQVRANALRRGQEALDAAELMGVAPEQVTFFGYPDAGTLAIWYRHWGARPSYRARLTRANEVPYNMALRPGAAYKGEEILQDLREVLVDFRPTKVFVSHPADHHPDHRSFYLYLTIALWELQGSIEPDVYPYLIHYAQWPQPLAYDPHAPLLPPPELQDTIAWLALPLSEAERDDKLLALQAHETQWGSGRRFLRRFVRQNELFGDFGLVDPLGVFPTSLESEEAGESAPIPQLLTEAEEELFVEVEQETIRVLDDRIILRLGLSRSLPLGTTVSLYLFGWHEDIAFAEMPKLHVRLARRSYDVFDQRTRLAAGTVDVERDGNDVRVEMPLSLLGEPQRLLLSAHSRTEAVPLDWAPWRAVDLDTALFSLGGD